MAQLPATPRTAARRPPPVVLPHPPRLSNGEIASVLERIADLLAVQGANVFRVRAYRDAARTLVSQSLSVHDMLAGRRAQSGTLSGSRCEMSSASSTPGPCGCEAERSMWRLTMPSPSSGQTQRVSLSPWLVVQWMR